MKLIKKSENEFVLIDKNGQQVDFQLDIKHIKNLLGEVDMEKKAEEYADFSNDYVPLTFGYKFNTNTKRDYLAGYNQCLEDNKEKKYTEEDMRKAWNAAFIDAMSIDEETYKPLFFEDFIQSFHPKTEWEVQIIDGKLKLK